MKKSPNQTLQATADKHLGWPVGHQGSAVLELCRGYAHLMIAILASVISAVWLVLLFVPLPNDPDGEGRLVLLVGVDVVLFLIGIVALILAARRRCSWFVASLIAITPLLHWLGSTLDVLGAIFIVVPSILVLIVTGAQQLRKFRSHAKDAT